MSESEKVIDRMREVVDSEIEKDEKLVDSMTEAHRMDEGDVCEICGNYSDDLRRIEGQLVCEECEETSSEV